MNKFLILKNSLSDPYADWLDPSVTIFPLSESTVSGLAQMQTRALLAYGWEEPGERPLKIEYLIHWHEIAGVGDTITSPFSLGRSSPFWRRIVEKVHDTGYEIVHLKDGRLDDDSPHYCIPTIRTDYCTTRIFLDGTVGFTSQVKHSHVETNSELVSIDVLLREIYPESDAFLDLQKFIGTMCSLSAAKVHPKTAIGETKLRPG